MHPEQEAWAAYVAGSGITGLELTHAGLMLKGFCRSVHRASGLLGWKAQNILASLRGKGPIELVNEVRASNVQRILVNPIKRRLASAQATIVLA